MLICPDCHSKLDSLLCSQCSFSAEVREQIPILLSEKDSKNKTFLDYNTNYDKISSDDLESGILDERYAEIQADKLFSYLGNISGLNVCDVGVGKGRLISRMLKANPKSVTGIDISINYLHRLVKIGTPQVILANAENLPFKDEFDLLVASDILEHVLNLGDFLISLNRAVKLGGSTVIRVPYLESLISYAKQAGCKYDFVHLRTFSKASLKETIISAGFEPVRFHYDGYVAYRVRDYIKNNKRLNEYFEQKFLAHYPSTSEMASVSNFWGRLLMRPAEIVVHAKKIKDLNYP